MNLRRSLRARLAVLYACLLLGSGLVLLVIADLPLTTFGRASQAHARGGAAGTAGQSRFVTNLPEVLLYSGIALAVLAVVSVALGWLVADRALRPLRFITAAARATSASSLDERLSLAGSYDEFRELGDTLDGLFARLEAAFESQRHFVANASHELRTPLAAERTVLQVALADPDASAESLRAACQQLLQLGEQQERLIDALLTLASSQRGLRNREPFDLAEVTARVVASRQPRGRPPGRTRGDQPRPGHRHRGPQPGREPRGQPGGQRHPAQRGRRSGPGHHRDARRPPQLLGLQQRPGDPAGRGRPAA